MVNVVGVGAGGCGLQKQQQKGVLSLTDFILSTPLLVPVAPEPLGDQLHRQLHKQDINSQDSSTLPLAGKMTAKAILQCRQNSHPFQERTLLLDSPVKIGRSVARSRPCNTNSIFDCKVLSRNHALLWYEDGKFYLQDTKSSNGTFVNNQRLSRGSEESAPREVCSGDIVQFGVDVMENSRKVTHGCIIATLRLYLPDGGEAKASPSLSVTGEAAEVTALRQSLQDAAYREAAIQDKLQALATILQATQDAANQSWSAMIGEDRLLQKLEMMEAQLATYAKNWPEDRLREEVRRLHEDKCQYESHVKDSLARMLSQKCAALSRLADAERSLASSEAELSQLRVVAESSQAQLTELLEHRATQEATVMTLQQQLQTAEAQVKEHSENGFTKQGSDDQLQLLREQFHEKCAKEEQLLAQVECAIAESDFTKQQLAALQARHGDGVSVVEGEVTQISDGVLGAEQRVLAARLRQYQHELNSGQVRLSALHKDVSAAEQAEKCLIDEKQRLEEELWNARSRVSSSNCAVQQLQRSISALQQLLQSHRGSVMPDLVAENCTTNNIVASNNDINTSLSDIDSNDYTAPEIYRQLYEDCQGSRKKDPSSEEDCIVSKKDDETEKKMKKEEPEELNKEKDGDGDDVAMTEKDGKANEVNNDVTEDSDEEEDLCSDKDVTLQDAVETLHSASPSAGQDALMAGLTWHLASLKEAHDSCSSHCCTEEGEVAALKERLQHAAAAAAAAGHETRGFKTALTCAEQSSDARLLVVSELQQSAARLGAAATIVTQQLQQLNTELLQQRHLLVEERSNARHLQERLQEAEALARQGVQQSEALSRQLEQVRQRAVEGGGLHLREAEARVQDLQQELDQLRALQVQGLLSNPAVLIEAKASANTPPEQQSETGLDEVEKLSDKKVENVSAKDEKQKKVSCTGVVEHADVSDGTVCVEKEPCEPVSQSVNTEPSEGTVDSVVMKLDEENCLCGDTPTEEGGAAVVASVEVGKELSVHASAEAAATALAAVQRECEALRDRLAAKDEDFTQLTLQNKTAFALSVVPLFVLLLAFVTAFHDCLAYITATHDYT